MSYPIQTGDYVQFCCNEHDEFLYPEQFNSYRTPEIHVNYIGKVLNVLIGYYGGTRLRIITTDWKGTVVDSKKANISIRKLSTSELMQYLLENGPLNGITAY